MPQRQDSSQPCRYTHTRAGGMLRQMRSEASTLTPASFGIGGTTA